MSRHELEPLNEEISCVVIGWEKALGSFFFQMYRTSNACPFDTPDDELGCDFGQVTTAETIITAVTKYARIPDDLNERLNTDKAREGFCEFPTAIQVMSAITPDTDWAKVPIPF